ncbi:uncharacterized protein LOC125766156 [Anopheles funestus]|uniref:uncharacterized protein LOC125760863 n=1 Tax=Anopheles funestus TaxID=62324 RepID=UPI0020C73870|nr:uncharacterized protein LOC125760863 [Anopheles funestus]XP_049286894.1 uncharacterized protein LOC125765608 [Anopheles funestus]XP_049287809.1 uncharacterized protein LOC125766156 [Anopheles funestus]
MGPTNFKCLGITNTITSYTTLDLLVPLSPWEQGRELREGTSQRSTDYMYFFRRASPSLLPKKIVRFSLTTHPDCATLTGRAEPVSTSYNTSQRQPACSTSLPSHTTTTLNTSSTSIKLNPGKAEIIERIYVNDSRTNNKFLIDTGAEISVIPPSYKDRMNPMPARKLFAANGSSIEIFRFRY